MYQEAAQAPLAVNAQLAQNAPLLRELGARLRAQPPRAVVTCARGSSDHAATYARYLIEAHTHVLTSSAAPSVSSVYDAQADLDGVLFIAISQSGKSPDLLAATRNAKDSGALTVALCNTVDSPLMELVDVAVPLHAGPERSVAATKSYIASLSCIAQLLANWTDDRRLLATLPQVPELLARAWECDWTPRRRDAARRGEPVRGGARLRTGHRAGSRAQAQGNLRPACRSLQLRRGQTRTHGAGARRFSGAHVHAAR